MLQSILAQRKAVTARLCYSLPALLPLLLLAGVPAKSGQPAVESPVVVNLLIDRKQNKDFIDEQNETVSKGFVYDFQDVSPDNLVIRPGSTEIMGVWKGNGTIRDDKTGTSEVFEEKIQFAPVLLVVDVTNKSGRAVQLTGAYLDVTESFTDLQPFLSVDTGDFSECGFVAEFNPELQFLDQGWGPVEEAKLTFSFGNENSTGGDAFSVDVGTFGDVKAVSIVEALAASGVNVDGVKAGGFKCASGSDEDIWNCTTELSESGLFGSLDSAVFPNGESLLTRVGGTLDYRWTDSYGVAHERHSPVSADISLLKFETGVEAECGAGGPIEREFKTLKLPLDRKGYRIPLPYAGQLAPLQNKRFALSLVADKSSQHFFRVVLQLSDGSTVSSPKVDLLYFIPRIVETN